MDYKYNELAYAVEVYEKGFLTKYFATELRLLVLYYRDVLELKPKEREFKIYEFCKKYIPNFRKEKFYRIINKALNNGMKKEQKLISISKIDIYKTEIDYINSLNVNQDYKKVMFTFLVQLRLNKIIFEYRHEGEEYNMSYFKGGVKKYNNIKRISNIPAKMLLNDEVINALEKLNLVTIVHKGTIILNYIDNCKQKGDVLFSITDFDNIGLYLDYYNGENGVIKCENEGCKKLIKKKSNNQKFCIDCAKKVEKENSVERKRKQRNNEKCHEVENL